jgi:hypothetical protein
MLTPNPAFQRTAFGVHGTQALSGSNLENRAAALSLLLSLDPPP